MTAAARACERLHARLRKLKGRWATRRWEYRQRDCAKGAWPQLCRALAHAQHAYAISEVELAELLAEGHTREAAGSRLQPPKQIVFVSPERARALRSRHEVPLHLSTELLFAERLALVRFASSE